MTHDGALPIVIFAEGDLFQHDNFLRLRAAIDL
jgi:hypothetical protein